MKITQLSINTMNKLETASISEDGLHVVTLVAFSGKRGVLVVVLLINVA